MQYFATFLNFELNRLHKEKRSSDLETKEKFLRRPAQVLREEANFYLKNKEINDPLLKSNEQADQNQYFLPRLTISIC